MQPHDAEKCQSLGQLHDWLVLFFQSGSIVLGDIPIQARVKIRNNFCHISGRGVRNLFGRFLPVTSCLHCQTGKITVIRFVAVREAGVPWLNSVDPLKPLNHQSTIVLRGLIGALNWVPTMPRDASLSDSERKCFWSGSARSVFQCFLIGKLCRQSALQNKRTKMASLFYSNHHQTLSIESFAG